MEIKTAGRTDLEALFEKSGLLSREYDPRRGGYERQTIRLQHTPFLAFVAADGEMEVRIVDRATELTALPDDTPVMVQWAGQWRSDFFRLTVAEVRAAMVARGLWVHAPYVEPAPPSPEEKAARMADLLALALRKEDKALEETVRRMAAEEGIELPPVAVAP